MRVLTFFLLLILTKSSGIAQNAPINFEPGGIGANWTWTVFENATNPSLEIVDNPSVAGINTSSKVAKFTALATGNPWAGCESLHGSQNLGPFVLNSTNSTIKIMVWKTVISPVGIKLVASTGWAQPEIKVSNTKINEWEELTFNFSGYLNPPASEGQLDQIVVFPDFNLSGRGQNNIVYFDNIRFTESGSTVSTNETVSDDESYKVYPNPVQSGQQFHIEKDVKEITVFDICGRHLKTFKTSIIRTDGLESGTYIIKIVTFDNDVLTKKLLVR